MSSSLLGYTASKRPSKKIYQDPVLKRIMKSQRSQFTSTLGFTVCEEQETEEWAPPIALFILHCSTKGSLTFTGRSTGILAIFDQLLKATCEGMKAQPGTDTAPTVKHCQDAQPSTPHLP